MPRDTHLQQHAQLFDLLRHQELNNSGADRVSTLSEKAISHADALLIQSQAVASFRAQTPPIGTGSHAKRGTP